MLLGRSSTSMPAGACDNEQGTVAIIVEAVLISLALLVVVFRLFSRIHAGRGLMINDYAMFIGMVGYSDLNRVLEC